MSIAVKWDPLEGGPRATLTDKGWSSARGATVSGLSAAGAARYAQARNALGVALHSPHPILPNCQLQSIEIAFNESGSVARAVCNYEPVDDQGLGLPEPMPNNPQFAEIQVGSSLIQETVNVDADGELITVTYTDAEGNKHSQGGTISRVTPLSTISYRRRESTSPAAKSREYTGKVNAAGWKLDPGAIARKWKCTGIIGSSSDGGQTYVVDYSFEYKLDGWWTHVVYIDPETGEPPSDVMNAANKDIAEHIVLRYKVIDFDGLNL